MEEKSVKRLGMIFSMMSAVAWGSYGVFSTSLLNANVREISLVGLASAALFVYFGTRVLCKPQVLKGTPFKYCICLFLQGLLLFNGMNYSYAHAYGAGMPMGIVSIVAFCNVLVVLVLSYFIFGYKFTMPKIISIFLAILGLSMVLGLFGRIEGQFTTAGLFWTALIPLFFGTNMVINKYFILKGVDTDVIMFCVTLGALSLILTAQVTPLELVRDLSIASHGKPVVWLYVVGFCVVPHALCYALTQEAMKRIEPSIHSICYSLDPVVALLLGLLVFAQPVAAIQVAGVILVLAAVVYINYMEGRNAPEA